HPPSIAAARPPAPSPSTYEPGHSARRATGSVPVGQGSWWTATLSVPMSGDQTALLTVERDGPRPASAPPIGQVTMVVPVGEMDAVLTLLQGIVAQSRRDGVLDATLP
ncbi:MAG TPA: hypothetical protein VE091_00255, partial [Gemmatimonadales bacterium]|nr:hypothetical protein [Gemmatimonadales bacterium]